MHVAHVISFSKGNFFATIINLRIIMQNLEMMLNVQHNFKNSIMSTGQLCNANQYNEVSQNL